jgi:hypothetical protein
MPIQLPNDAVANGYKETHPFHHAQMFHSPSRNFTGTEEEYLAAGYAYRYVQIEKYVRLLIAG